MFLYDARRIRHFSLTLNKDPSEFFYVPFQNLKKYFEQIMWERIDTVSKYHPRLRGISDYLKREKKLEKVPTKRIFFAIISRIHKR